MKDYTKIIKVYERANPTLCEQVSALELARQRKQYIQEQLADGIVLVTQYSVMAVVVVSFILFLVIL